MKRETFTLNYSNRTRWILANGSYCHFSIEAFWEAIGYRCNKVWIGLHISYYFDDIFNLDRGVECEA